MQWMDGKFKLRDITNLKWMKEQLREKVVDFQEFPDNYIKRCVGIFLSDELCGFLMTIENGGIRSFHGFKFCEWHIEDQMRISKKYIEDEKLEFSSYTKKEAGAVLRRLGFQDFCILNGVHLARKA